MKEEKDKKGRFKKGNSGRPRGAKDKLTTNIKEMVFNALNDKRVGGQQGFVQWILASNRNKELFYTWLMKMLPTSLVGEQDDEGKFKPLEVVIIDNGNKPDNPT